MSATDGKGTPMLDYNLSVKGVWGRNRTVKSDIVNLVRVGADKPQELGAVLAAATLECKKMRVKPGARVRIGEYPITVEKQTSSAGSEYEVVSFLLCHDRTLVRGVWNGSEICPEGWDKV